MKVSSVRQHAGQIMTHLSTCAFH